MNSVTPMAALDRASQVESDDPTPAPVVLDALRSAGMLRVASKCFRRVPTPAVPVCAKIDSEPDLPMTGPEEADRRRSGTSVVKPVGLAPRAKPRSRAKSKAKAKARPKPVKKHRNAKYVPEQVAEQEEQLQQGSVPASDIDEGQAPPGSDTVTENSDARPAPDVITISSSVPGDGYEKSPPSHETPVASVEQRRWNIRAPQHPCSGESEIMEDNRGGQGTFGVEQAARAHGVEWSCAGSGPIDICTQDSLPDIADHLAPEAGVDQQQPISFDCREETNEVGTQPTPSVKDSNLGDHSAGDAVQQQVDRTADHGAGVPDTVDECDLEPRARRRPSLLRRLIQRQERTAGIHGPEPRSATQHQLRQRSRHAPSTDVASNLDSTICIPAARGAARIGTAKHGTAGLVKGGCNAQPDKCLDANPQSPERQQVPYKRLKKDVRSDFVFQWINEAAADYDDRCRVAKLAEGMGARIVSGDNLHPDTTHVVAVVLHRSPKYLYAAAKGIPFVSPSFLQAIAEDPSACQQVESHCVTCWGELPMLGATPKHRLHRPFDGVEVVYLQLPNIPDLPSFATIADLVRLGGGTISRQTSHRATVVVSQEVSRLPAKRRSALPHGAMYVCYLLDVLVLGTAAPHPSCYLARNTKTHVGVVR